MSVPSGCREVLVIVCVCMTVPFILFSVFKPPRLLAVLLHFKSLHIWNQPKILTEDCVVRWAGPRSTGCTGALAWEAAGRVVTGRPLRSPLRLLAFFFFDGKQIAMDVKSKSNISRSSPTLPTYFHFYNGSSKHRLLRVGSLECHLQVLTLTPVTWHPTLYHSSSL